MDKKILLNTFMEFIDNEYEFEKELNKLNPKDVFKFSDVFWEYTLKECKKNDSNFSREEITKFMEPTSDYMYRIGCTYKPNYCRAKICYHSNPNCASTKEKGAILVLRKILNNLKINKKNT